MQSFTCFCNINTKGNTAPNGKDLLPTTIFKQTLTYKMLCMTLYSELNTDKPEVIPILEMSKVLSNIFISINFNHPYITVKLLTTFTEKQENFRTNI